jgi:hypothetical protein
MPPSTIPSTFNATWFPDPHCGYSAPTRLLTGKALSQLHDPRPVFRSQCVRVIVAVTKPTGERWLAAELNRHKGQLLLRQGHPEAAEELYRKALSIAEEQEAKLWELRAAASLARLRRDQGRRAEARDLLAPVYGWFTEGFGTPDLKEAKALLDELT